MAGSRKPDENDRRRGLELAGLRKSRGMSRKDLGAELGISPQQIAKYELGENRIAAGMFDRAMVILRGPDAQPSGFGEAETPAYVSPAADVEELRRALRDAQKALDAAMEILKRMRL